MSVIQKIRDKAAWLVFGLIALSLIGFLLMDAFVGKGRMMRSNSTELGVVNGKTIEYAKFQQMTQDREDQAKASGYPMNDMMQQNIKDQVWKQMVEEDILDKIYEQLPIVVTDRELNDMLVGPNAIPDIKKSFTDPKTGIFDAQAAANAINQLQSIYKGNRRTDKGYEQARRFFEESEPEIIQSRQKEKYLSLVGNSAYVPKWMAEKMNTDMNELASINYTSIPYSTVPDSSVKVTDDQIAEYVSQHPDQYKQEETRTIEYVSYSAAPTSADTANVLQALLKLRPEFDTTQDIQTFMARNQSENGFLNSYLPKSQIQVPKKDSIFPLKNGQLYGPYMDAGSYVIAKKIDEKVLPDSVRARHILVATVDPKTGQTTLDDSSAKVKIDSIKNLIEHGARFDSLAVKLSDDGGSKDKGGDLGYFTVGTMVPEFNDFCFNGKTGEKKIVKTQFGYHYIEITDQKRFEPAFKIAYLTKKIEASPETEELASGLANKFAGENRSQKAFEEAVQKQNLQKLTTPEIQPTESSIPGLGTSRAFIRWIFDDKTSLGDVSDPYAIGDKYVVAAVTEINHKGTMNAAKARPMVEPILRSKLKAEQIIKKLGNANTLEAAAAATGQQVLKADSVSFSAPFIPNLGQEPKVIGASFDKQLVGKAASQPIPGNGGVFLIKVNSTSAKAGNMDIEAMRANLQRQQQSLITYRVTEVLEKSATIKDYRAKFF